MPKNLYVQTMDINKGGNARGCGDGAGWCGDKREKKIGTTVMA